MSRIAKVFEGLREQGRRALIPYVTAGDPDPASTVDVLCAMADAGADVLELGVPFSDPMADGPVIQRASERALARGIGLRAVLQMVRDFRGRNQHTPVVLMGYANPIERYGVESFVAEAASAGVDGVLVVDYPPEEAEAFSALLSSKGLDLIFLLAPTSTPERMRLIGRLARGYVYYVSLTGVTGAAHLDVSAVTRMVPAIKEWVSVPVGVGFGIRDGETARAVAQVADAVVIGSRLVQMMADNPQAAPQVAAAFMADIRLALDA